MKMVVKVTKYQGQLKIALPKKLVLECGMSNDRLLVLEREGWSTIKIRRFDIKDDRDRQN